MKEDLKQLGFDFTTLPSEPVEKPAVMLSKVAIVRHGEYDFRTKRLNEYGKSQIGTLSQRLERISRPEDIVALLSSTAPRALDSAEILKETFKVPVQSYPVLWSDTNPYRPENLEAAHQLIHSAGSSLVIVVTHYEYASRLPSYLCRQDLGENCSHGPIEKGEGVLIDYRARSLAML